MSEYVDHSLCMCSYFTGGHTVRDVTKDLLAESGTARLRIVVGAVFTLVVATEIDDGVRTDDGVESNEEEAGDGVWMSVEDVSEEDDASKGGGEREVGMDEVEDAEERRDISVDVADCEEISFVRGGCWRR